MIGTDEWICVEQHSNNLKQYFRCLASRCISNFPDDRIVYGATIVQI